MKRGHGKKCGHGKSLSGTLPRNAMPRSTRIRAASLAACAAILGCTPLAAEDQPSSYRDGDAVIVTTEGAPLQVGAEVRARLRRGETLRVLGIRGGWIWTAVDRGGREAKGWINAAHVRLRPPAAPAPVRDPRTRLEGSGARLTTNEDGAITAVDFQGKRVAPAVLAELDQLGSLRELSLGSCAGISDGSLRAIGAIEALQLLDLSFCGDVTDAGLEHLRGLKNLRRLNLAGTALTDAGLASIGELTALEELDVSGDLIRRGSLDGSGLRHLKALTRLRRLSLYNTFVDDAGLHALEKLPALEALNLGDTWIGPDGLSRLGALKELRELRLAYCGGIDDSALEALATLTQLEDLDLAFCRITDAGAEHLAGMRKLHRLVLTGTRITEAVEARLAAALPDCKIER